MYFVVTESALRHPFHNVITLPHEHAFEVGLVSLDFGGTGFPKSSAYIVVLCRLAELAFENGQEARPVIKVLSKQPVGPVHYVPIAKAQQIFSNLGLELINDERKRVDEPFIAILHIRRRQNGCS